MTEQEIFKEFETLGYQHIDYRNVDEMRLLTFVNKGKKINIWFDRSYSIPNDYDLTLREHQLLHKLFEIWGWFDE